jgi:RimJ/RimL family protein N-acetyltransferase
MLEDQRPRAGGSTFDYAELGNAGPVDIVPFRSWHFQMLDVQPEQWAWVPRLTPQYGIALEKVGGSFSAFQGADVIAMAGIVQIWPERAQVWALFAPAMAARVIVIHRAVCKYLRQYQCARVECVIDPTFTRSVEWARRLGFGYESTMPKYGTEGQTMDMYVRIR